MIAIVTLLKKLKIKYCILHDWQNMADRLASDLDIVVCSEDLKQLEVALFHFEGARVVQLLQYESSCFFFVLAAREKGEFLFIAVDAVTDYRRNWRIFFKADELLTGRRQLNGLWIASSMVEFGYLIVKKVLKGSTPDYQKKRLSHLVQKLGDKSLTIALNLFGENRGNLLISLIRENDWNAFEENLPLIKKGLLRQVAKKDPFNVLRYWLPEMARIWRRILYPTGLIIAVLGPDGSGKSTLIENLLEQFLGAFRQTSTFHLRPGITGMKKINGPVIDPHSEPLHPLLLSLLKIPYYMIDYIVGYLTKVLPKLIKSTLVLFDRYYEDMLVDPRRYRYGGPPWALRVANKFIPKPDLFLILDVPEKQLITRKKEVSFEELMRQRKAYRQLSGELENVIFLDGNLPSKEVARNAGEVILDYLHSRYLKRRNIWFDDDRSRALQWLKSVISSNDEMLQISWQKPNGGKNRSGWQANRAFGWLTLKDGRGYLIPTNSRKTTEKALELYNAQNMQAKLAKKLINIASKCGCARALLHKVRLFVHDDVSDGEISEIFLLEHIENVLHKEDLDFTISLGTPGPHRKPVIQVHDNDGRILGYAKVGWNDATNKLVEREVKVLNYLSNLQLDTFVTPRVLYSGMWNNQFLCIQSSPEGQVRPAPQEMNSKYLSALDELASLNNRSMPLKKSDFWTNLLERIENVSNAYYRHLLRKGICKIENCFDDMELPFHCSHSDFAPWNAKLVDGNLFLFDWEYAKIEAPVGLDFIHFFIQTQRLLKKKSPGEICKALFEDRIVAGRMIKHLETLGVEKKTIFPIFNMYLVEQLAFYATEDPANFEVLHYLAMILNLSIHRERLF